MGQNLFLRKPYPAMVLAVITVLCGLLALFHMPVEQFPDITPPQVAVTFNYPGAGALTLLQSAVIPLEQEINGAPGLIYLDSTASDSGQGVVTASFAIGTDAETARQNVQDRVNWATPQLPQPVREQGVTVRSQSGNILLALAVEAPNGDYDALFMSNFALIRLRDELARVPGVANVQLFGGAPYAMRIWLNADRCTALKVSPEEIVAALQSQNFQVSSGSVGAAPAAARQTFCYNVHVRGRLSEPVDFAAIVIRSRNGAELKLGDVARIELGAEDYSTAGAIDNKPVALMLIFPDNGANGIAVSQKCREVAARAEKEFPPGLRCAFPYDSTAFVRAGIRDVAVTLLGAIALVTLVTLVFLGNWRMALIPTLAIPVSIAGSFAVLYLLGFSINMITLFALTLAIGIVVDDAIVVIENVSRLMETRHLHAPEAAEQSMSEITGAIVATTLVLLAMFVPITFFGGITGELYRQFGVTLSVAVLLSAINALTLSPALCSILLPDFEKPEPSKFDRTYGRVEAGGASVLAGLCRHLRWTAPLYLVLAAGLFFWFSKRPTGFIPEEDQGYFFAQLQMPPGSSLERTRAATAVLSEMIQRTPGVAASITVPGYDVLNSTPSADTAFLIADLKPWGTRPPAAELMRKLQIESYYGMAESFAMFFNPPAIPGIGMAGGFNLQLEERTGEDPGRLAAVTRELLGAAAADPALANVFSAYQADTPGIFLEIDRPKAYQLGVSQSAINSALESLLGYRFINFFNRFGQVYKVEIQGRESDRADAADILRLHVANANGEMVPMASIGKLRPMASAESLSRHNLRLAASIQGGPAPGFSSGEAMAAITGLAAKILPPDMTFEWTGMSYQEVEAGNSAPWILLLAGGFIYLFLAGLYESWLLPWSVLPVIPAALGGALALSALLGLETNIYMQIGLVLLFGMGCKTAILVADFALKRRREGAGAGEAARDGAKLRFRAVMMTSLAFTFGALPLVFATGAGAASRRSIGIPVVGGMLGVVLGGLLVAPCFFQLTAGCLDWLGRRKNGKKAGLLLLSALSAAALAGGCYQPPPGGRLVGAESLEAAAKAEPERRFPADTGTLTREQAVAMAFRNNPDYMAAFSALRGAQLRYYQAIGGYSPTLSVATAVGGENYGGGGSGSSSGSGGYSSTAIQATWILFDGLAREFGVLAASEQISMREKLTRNARRVLRRGVLTAYEEVLEARAERLVAAADLAFQLEALREAEIRYRIGESPWSDVLNFRGQSESAEMAQVRAGLREETARFALALLLGVRDGRIPAGTVLEEEDAAMRSELLPPVEILLDEALVQRPDLGALRAGLQILRYQYYQKLGAFMPVIGAFASYNYSSNSVQFNDNLVTAQTNMYDQGWFVNYGAFATMNVWNGLRDWNALRAARTAADEGYLRGSMEWLRVVNGVRGAYADSLRSAQIMALAKKRCETLLEERTLTKKEYDVGEIEVLKLRQVQQDYVKSENEYIAARASWRKARAKLEAEVGRGTDESAPPTAPTPVRPGGFAGLGIY